ncbi:MAG: hypothetical protein GX303_06645 [Clostridiales bacterium]|nr:hypothetical protein [Clostridiales bacterium]
MKARLLIFGFALALVLSSCRPADATIDSGKDSDTTVQPTSDNVTTEADIGSSVTTALNDTETTEAATEGATEAVTTTPDTTDQEEFPITIRSIDIDQNIRIGMKVFDYQWGYFYPDMEPVGMLTVEMPLPRDKNYPIEEIILREWSFGIVAYDYDDIMAKIEKSDDIIHLFNSLYWSAGAVYPLENHKVIESAYGYEIYEFYHGMSEEFIEIYSPEANENYLSLREYLYLITDGKTVVKIIFSTEMPGFDIDRGAENEILDYLIENLKLSY